MGVRLILKNDKDEYKTVNIESMELEQALWREEKISPDLILSTKPFKIIGAEQCSFPSGEVIHGSESALKLADQENLGIETRIGKFQIKPDNEFINNACLSYAHDFGLMPPEDQEMLRNQCVWWINAINNSL
jgi:hypothetical protein